jgi:hypothetical protein
MAARQSPVVAVHVPSSRARRNERAGGSHQAALLYLWLSDMLFLHGLVGALNGLPFEQ